MRILLLADIHANWPALSAVNESFDVCLVLGDLVDYGLEPSPCIQWVRQNATHAVRGNHDHGVAQFVHVQGKNGFKYLTGVTRQITQERITSEDRRFLGALPISKRVTLDGAKFLLVRRAGAAGEDQSAGDRVSESAVGLAVRAGAGLQPRRTRRRPVGPRPDAVQESGVRGQESGVRGQESGVRSQESGVRSQESGVRSHLTLTPDS